MNTLEPGAGASSAQTALDQAAGRASEWLREGRLAEGRSVLEQALAVPGADARTGARARVLLSLGTMLFFLGDARAARPHFQEALALGEELQDREVSADACIGLARVSLAEADPQRMRGWAERSRAIAASLEDRGRTAVAIHHAAAAARMAGDLDRAAELFEESLVIRRAAADENGVGLELGNLGTIALQRGEIERSEELLTESLRIAVRLGSHRSIPFRLIGLAGVATARGKAEAAARILGAADARMEQLGTTQDPSARDGRERVLARTRAALDPHTFEAAWSAGRALPIDAAVAEILTSRRD